MTVSNAADIRALLARFPQDMSFEMLEALISRSGVLRAQHDAEGCEGSFQVPRDHRAAWVQCVMSTTKELEAQDDERLVQYLQVCIFLLEFLG